mmetsp:Transcript_18326/g.59529  ORF Transcript_18326/g.59529 Transcript_18326/m.59529 type:complete len:538 (-) Transcript_18326:963-2576(-)
MGCRTSRGSHPLPVQQPARALSSASSAVANEELRVKLRQLLERSEETQQRVEQIHSKMMASGPPAAQGDTSTQPHKQSSCVAPCEEALDAGSPSEKLLAVEHFHIDYYAPSMSDIAVGVLVRMFWPLSFAVLAVSWYLSSTWQGDFCLSFKPEMHRRHLATIQRFFAIPVWFGLLAFWLAGERRSQMFVFEAVLPLLCCLGTWLSEAAVSDMHQKHWVGNSVAPYATHEDKVDLKSLGRLAIKLTPVLGIEALAAHHGLLAVALCDLEKCLCAIKVPSRYNRDFHTFLRSPLQGGFDDEDDTEDRTQAQSELKYDESFARFLDRLTQPEAKYCTCMTSPSLKYCESFARFLDSFLNRFLSLLLGQLPHVQGVLKKALHWANTRKQVDTDAWSGTSAYLENVLAIYNFHLASACADDVILQKRLDRLDALDSLDIGDIQIADAHLVAIESLFSPRYRAQFVHRKSFCISGCRRISQRPSKHRWCWSQSGPRDLHDSQARHKLCCCSGGCFASVLVACCSAVISSISPKCAGLVVLRRP